jgi:DNA-binding MarR family transcriptional regulator
MARFLRSFRAVLGRPWPLLRADMTRWSPIRRAVPDRTRHDSLAIVSSPQHPHPFESLVSIANYHPCMAAPTHPRTVDLPALAAHLRISVFRTARRLRYQGDAGVTPTLLAALATIERHGPMTPGDLAAHEHVRKPTTTRIVASLLELGMIERTPDPLDGRVAWVQITAAGSTVLQRVRRRNDAFLSTWLKRLTPDEIDTLAQAAALLDRLTEDDR